MFSEDIGYSRSDPDRGYRWILLTSPPTPLSVSALNFTAGAHKYSLNLI